MNKFEELNSVIDFPRLFLSNFFSDIRNRIDSIYFQREIDERDLQIEKRNKKDWLEIIDKITQFENQCLKQKLSPKLKAEFKDKLEAINVLLNDYKQVLFDLEESKILKNLFLNQTLYLMGDQKDIKLLLITDEFIHPRDINNLNKKLEDDSEGNILQVERIKLIVLQEKLNSELVNVNEMKLEIDKVSKLNLSSKRLAAIDKSAFDELKNLKELNLSINSINTNESFLTLQSLVNLQSLNLSRNKITKLPEEALIGLRRLKILNLSRNQLTNSNLHPLAFECLSDLQQLDLSNNYLTTINANNFKNLTNLNDLKLNDNQLVSVELNAFNNLKDLKALFLHRNRLTVIESNTLNELSNLNELWLKNNKIKSIDIKTLSELKNLHKLYLQDNQIEYENLNLIQKMQFKDLII